MQYEVESESRVEQPTATIHGTVSAGDISHWMPRAYESLFRHLASAGVEPAGPPYARYVVHDDAFEVEAGVPVTAPIAGDDQVHPGTLPGGPAAVTLHRGPYDTVDQAVEAVRQWVAEHGYQPSAELYESYLTDPVAEPDPADWRTVVVQPYSLSGRS